MDENYVCTNCSVISERLPDDQCLNCNGIVDEVITLEDNWWAEAEGEFQYECSRDSGGGL